MTSRLHGRSDSLKQSCAFSVYEVVDCQREEHKKQEVKLILRLASTRNGICKTS